MRGRTTQPDARERRQWFAAVRAWAGVMLASFLLAVPVIRSNELNEISSAKERVEDATLLTRVVNKRTYHQVRHDAISSSTSTQVRPHGRPRVELSRTDGHRLPNGLLAPMTC